MNISARVSNSYGEHQVTLTTNGNAHSIVFLRSPQGSAPARMGENSYSWRSPPAIAMIFIAKRPGEV